MQIMICVLIICYYKYGRNFMKVIIGVRFKKPGKIYFFDPGTIHINVSTKVIVETALGEELGEVVVKKKLMPDTKLNTPLKKIIRIANYKDIKHYVIDEVIPSHLVDDTTKFYINPTGRFVIGGPNGDSGLTGRKIIVDTYGGYARHGGGAFSGKDPTKVDRSAAYASRWVAKNVVAAGLAKKCEVQLAYAIGVAHPVSIMVDTFGTATVDEDKIEQAIEKVFDLRPHAIIKQLDLRKPIYKNLAAYGHMGREDLGVSWEKLDKVEELKAAIK